jgi:hypothetical protein
VQSASAFKLQTQKNTIPHHRHSKRGTQRSGVSDLEARFGGEKRDGLRESGVPARASQGLRLAGMTVGRSD